MARSVKRNFRKEAEKILKDQNSFIPPDPDILKLVHELSVHQIELELQNEELREARDVATRLAEKYTELYDFAPSGYFTLTPEGKIEELNLNAAKMLGKGRINLKKVKFENFLNLHYKDPFSSFFREVYESNVSHVCDILLNNNIHLHLTGINENGLCKLSAIDISSIKETERKNEILLFQLKEAKQKLELALENANIGNWELNISPLEIMLDERMSRIMGLNDRKNTLRFHDFLKLIHEEDSSRVNEEFSQSIKKNLPLETVFRFISKENISRYLSCKGAFTFDDKKNYSGFSGVCIDITRIYESSAQSLTRLNAKLIKSNKDLENFAYVASHDLQEPLRMVSSFTQLLERQYGDKLDENAHEYIKFAVQGAKRMYDLLNSLLAYSRIQAKEEKFNVVDLNEVIDKISDNLQLLINERKVVIEKTKLPSLTADHTLMLQLMQNLVENGIKFTSREPHILISSEKMDGFHIISVKDNGIGIEKDFFDRIFKIFQRLHSVEDYPGTGIGLAICKSIVERHGGKIWLESQPGSGTTFFFTVPAGLD